MTINETTILIACFVITFGFLGYKLAGFVKNVLDKYSKQIEDNINESEKLKMEALKALDEAKNKEKFLTDEVEKIKDEADENMSRIRDNFDAKLRELTEKAINDNKNKIAMEKDTMIEKFKSQIENVIKKIIEQYAVNLSKEEKNKAFENAIQKIDFNKLFS